MEPFSIVVKDNSGKPVKEVDVVASDPVDAVRKALEHLEGKEDTDRGTSDPVLPEEGHP